MKKTGVLLVNFGGPRNLEEIKPFLVSLLTDQDVIRTSLPSFLHRLFFSRIAKKRAKQIKEQYERIGGGSPIFSDTEQMAGQLEKKLGIPFLTFHRYLPSTHSYSLQAIKRFKGEDLIVFPFFPQFTYATSGSIARFFERNLPRNVSSKLRWIKSFPEHPCYLDAMERVLRDHLEANKLSEADTILLFSAHGVPCKFIETGDIYEKECRQTFDALRKRFPLSTNLLSYQSKFGKGEWISPSTHDVCQSISCYPQKNVVIVPLTFPSDHIETLFEIQYEYLPILVKNGKNAFRCPAMNHHPIWYHAIEEMVQTPPNLTANAKLVRHKRKSNLS